MSIVQQRLPEAIAQIDACGFECEAGPLSLNVAYQWLKQASADGPEFMPGQWVWFEVEAEATGKTLRQWVKFCIVGCRMNSNTERCYWVYDLSYDPPAPWHYGVIHFTGIPGEKLTLVKPAVAVAA